MRANQINCNIVSSIAELERYAVVKFIDDQTDR